MRTVPGISMLLGPLEEAVRNVYVTATTNGICPSNKERSTGITAKKGWFGQDIAETEFESSLRLMANLTGYIVGHFERREDGSIEIISIKNEVSNRGETMQMDLLQDLMQDLPQEIKRRSENNDAINWSIQMANHPTNKGKSL